MVHEHLLVRDEGSGSREAIQDMYDGEEYENKDSRANTRTTYYERDIDKYCTDPRYAGHMRRALELQEGQHVNDPDKQSRGQQNHEEDKRRLIGAIGSQLGLTTAQKQRVKHLVMEVLSVNSFGHYSTEQVVIATCNVVAREDGRWIEEEDKFRSVVHDVELRTARGNPDMDAVKRLRGLVRDRIPREKKRKEPE